MCVVLEGKPTMLCQNCKAQPIVSAGWHGATLLCEGGLVGKPPTEGLGSSCDIYTPGASCLSAAREVRPSVIVPLKHQINPCTKHVCKGIS